MTTRNFNPEERAKLKNLMTEAIGVMSEIEVLSGGLNDTISAIADEMQIKPGVLKKAVKMAQKQDFDRARDDLDLIESILNSTDKLQNPED